MKKKNLLFLILLIFTVSANQAYSDINPADPSGKTMYPSGNLDIDKHIFGAPESTKMPLLSLGYEIFDKNSKLIPVGFYKASISEDDKYILLYQNSFIIGVLNINKLKTLDKPAAINNAVLNNCDKESCELVIRQDTKEAMSKVGINPR